MVAVDIVEWRETLDVAADSHGMKSQIISFTENEYRACSGQKETFFAANVVKLVNAQHRCRVQFLPRYKQQRVIRR